LEILMHTKTKLALALLAAALSAPAFAQQPAPTSSTVVASEPGKAVIANVAELSAQVVGIDKATRTLTLKGPKGNVVDVVAGPEVKNFDQIKPGDVVVARYAEAFAFELRKTRTDATGPVVTEGAAKAKAGEKPAVAGARQVTVIAEVTDVDPKKSTITLKGPKGNEMTLPVKNPDQFKVVKKGDQVEVSYTEALALSVETAKPAPKPAEAKKPADAKK
jgi:hypothetical protein